MVRKKKGADDIRKWFRYQFFGSALIKTEKGKSSVETTVANISFSGMGVYSSQKVDKGTKVSITVSFVNREGKTSKDIVSGKVDWQKKFKKMYLLGILFDEELNMKDQPGLLPHLLWLIETFNQPQPYEDKRIAIL